MAKNNRPNQNKRPTEYTRPAGSPKPSGPGGAQAAFTSPKPGQSSDKSANPDFSKAQDEVSKGASPQRNTVPNSNAREANVPNSTAKKGESPEFSTKQDEFDTAASPSKNTAPQSTSPSAIDPAEAQFENKPLPDLTQGIPSTLEFETTGRTSKASPLNLTEAADPEEAPGSGGKGRGELPASAYVSSTERRRNMLANYMYLSFAIFATTGAIYLGRNWDTEEEEREHEKDAPSGWSLTQMWNRAKARTGDQLNYYNEPSFPKLLPDPHPSFEKPYTLVLGMEDLLIHSEWTREHGWRLAKRPGVDYFLRYLSQYYELVIFTTQPFALAEQVIQKFDPYHIIQWPLFREATFYEKGEYIKVWFLCATN